MLLPCSLLYAVLLRRVSCLLVVPLSLIVLSLPLLMRASVLSLLPGMILLPATTLRPLSLRPIRLSMLIVPLPICVLRLLPLFGPLLLTMLVGLGLLVLAFFLV